MQLAACIVQLRQDCGLSMEAFASRLGVSQPTQSRIERAKRLPDALYLRALMEHFHVDINALLLGERNSLAAIKPDEKILLDNYRNSAPEDQLDLKAPRSQSTPTKKTVRSRKDAA